MRKKNITQVYIALCILLAMLKLSAENDSVLILAEKCSYQFPPEYPDSLDIMYHNPFEWIREGIRITANSKGNDLNGYKFLVECNFNGKINCIKSNGPNEMICNKITSFLNKSHIKPWIDISDYFDTEPAKLLITWTKDDCIIERIIDINELKENESRLFVREWKSDRF